MKKYIATCYGSIIEEGGNPERCEFMIIANDREEAEDLCKSEVVSILNDNMFIEHVEIEDDGIMAHRTDGTKEWYADFDAEEMVA